MSTRHTGREHKTRDNGRSPRAKMVRQVETTILSSSDTRVKAGERAKLQLMSDGSLRLLLLEQMGMARTHGRKVACLAQDDDGAHLSGQLDNGYSDYDYFIPWEAYAEVKGEAQ